MSDCTCPSRGEAPHSIDCPAEPCPRQELHTPAPSGYLQWHAWAQRMSKTHRQERCPGCDLYAIWRLRGFPR